ncbi:MAG: hypothetical protein H6627_14775 [Calditrichae bacterium]|nr:hypothetical protein [Calditrichota bacterium]MCB9059828.1 hypothetical protein [Calditrichia bacterium]
MIQNLFTRLRSLPTLKDIPDQEIDWLVNHGNYEVYDPGTVVAAKNLQIDSLYIFFSGYMTIRVDRGAGPKLVSQWQTGDITGMLPYSRMRSTPGDTIIEEKAEVLRIYTKYFPEMIISCPKFTAHTVHIMIDRARSFTTSDLQDEKMISLGKLSAGLAHELNNPASALLRNAKLLVESLPRLESYSRMIGAAGLLDNQFELFVKLRDVCLAQKKNGNLSPIEKADLHDQITVWLEKNRIDISYAAQIVDSNISFENLQFLEKHFSGNFLKSGLTWLCANCASHSLADEMEKAAAQIYKLVDAVKKFSYMDHVIEREYVDVASGIRDTLRILESKIKSKNAGIVFKPDNDIPNVYANGSDLNQVWLSLIDNALDAIPPSGKILINACYEMNRVIVRIIDNGPGIAKKIITKIFDPFFTTKPPGAGIGLGLDIARRLIRRYKGDIHVTSNPGRTEFYVSLIVSNV